MLDLTAAATAAGRRDWGMTKEGWDPDEGAPVLRQVQVQVQPEAEAEAEVEAEVEAWEEKWRPSTGTHFNTAVDFWSVDEKPVPKLGCYTTKQKSNLFG